MSEAKHTPGPLTYKPHLGAIYGEVRPGIQAPVAQLRDALWTNEQIDANGYLFAAAPELLKAIETIMGMDDISSLIEDICNKAWAKATGG